MAAPLATALKAAFLVMECVIAAVVIHLFVTDASNFYEELTPWMIATLVDLYINFLPVMLWIIYKESNWILSVIWIIPIVVLGSMVTCGYIFLQLLKLSPEESKQDPIFFVLLSKKKDERRSKGILSVVSARVLFSALGCVMIGMLIYTTITDGSPFRKGILTPLMTATLVDFYINVFVLSVWIMYKESSWKTAVLWIVLLICLGSPATTAYIVLQLFRVSPQDPVFLVLFNDRFMDENVLRAGNGGEGTLIHGRGRERE